MSHCNCSVPAPWPEMPPHLSEALDAARASDDPAAAVLQPMREFFAIIRQRIVLSADWYPDMGISEELDELDRQLTNLIARPKAKAA